MAKRIDKVRNNCVICSYASQNKPSNGHLVRKGRAEIMCQVLKIPVDPFKNIFENADYCGSCYNRIEQLASTINHITKLETKIIATKMEMEKDLRENYKKIVDRNTKTQKSSKSKRFEIDDYNKIVSMIVERIEENKHTEVDTGEVTQSSVLSHHTSAERDSDGSFSVSPDTLEMDTDESDDNSDYGEAEKIEPENSNRVGLRRTRSQSKPIISQEIKNGAANELSDLDAENKCEEVDDDDADFNYSGSDNSEDEYVQKSKSVSGASKTSNRKQKCKQRKSSVEPQFTCTYEGCRRRFKYEFSKSAHFRRCHEGNPKPYQCELCEKGFTTSTSYHYHKLSHDTSRPFVCEHCGKSFQVERNLNSHMLLHDRLPFSCSFCAKGFKKREALEMHVQIHQGKTPFVCDICQEVSTNSLELKTHMKIHDSTAIKCSECGKTFSSALSLKQHQKRHKNELKFHCSECQLTFACQSQLQQHILSHSEEKRFVCETCGKAFKYSSGLIIHRRLHTGLFPYDCKICSKTFRDSGHLNRHEQIHSGLKPYKCSICEKCFRTKQNYTQHYKIHDKEKYPPKQRIRIRKTKSAASNKSSTAEPNSENRVSDAVIGWQVPSSDQSTAIPPSNNVILVNPTTSENNSCYNYLYSL